MLVNCAPKCTMTPERKQIVFDSTHLVENMLKKNQHSFSAASLLRSFKKDIPKPELEFRFKPQPSSIKKLKNQGKIIIEYIYSFLSICKRIIHSQKCHALTHNVTLHVTHRLRKYRVMH